MSREYHFGVFIGRFAPVHNGHIKVMMEALEKCDYLIVIVGSNNVARNTRNPFTAIERMQMIYYATDYEPRIIMRSVGDYPYNEPRWLAQVQDAVDNAIHDIMVDDPVFTVKGWTDYNYRIALAGMYKDATSYYLNSFPQWSNSIAVMPGSTEGEILSATGIRNRLFNGELAYAQDLHPSVKLAILNDEEHRPEIWDRLRKDWKYEQSYEAKYGKGPHVTVDNLVTQSGHLLLIRRGQEYGHGLWAMPGGFLNRREKIVNGAIRELKEETKLKVPEKVLYGSIKEVKTYDDPYRSNRSHIITHVHRIELENVKAGLPEVVGSDDAEKAKWIPISEVKAMMARNEFFEDHAAIIADMLGL